MAEQDTTVAADGVHRGEGWAVGSLDDLGSGPGFRKIRTSFGVEAFGANAIVLPPGFDATRHSHESQEELYFVHSGSVRVTIGDGDDAHSFDLGAGGIARVDAPVIRQLSNIGSDKATIVIVGGKGGYVGRDGIVH